MFNLPVDFFSNAWKVLILFLIPIGGGIPAGVVLARSLEFSWPIMCGLYFISDVILACAFEPLMLLFVKHSQTNTLISRFRELLAQTTQTVKMRYGLNPGPFTLVMISFGTDPMTGRCVTKGMGYGFFSGWFITIAGDMFYFLVLMVSTLWVDNILGNGTLAAVIVMFAMLVIPALVRRLRK